MYSELIYKDMKDFKKFIESEEEDVHKSLAKLPAAYQKLAHGFKVSFEPSHTLKGDDKHIGEIILDKKQKRIRVCSPWNYGRSFAFLHEIGHLVWEKYIKGTDLEKEWISICKNTKDKKKDEPEDENFCHAFANQYVKFPLVIHDHPEWKKFIKKVAEVN